MAEGDVAGMTEQHAIAERVDARVTGRVQGVGFRWWVVERAKALGVTGWVMNEDDERALRVVAEGAPHALDALVEALRRGPTAARVESVDARRQPASGEHDRFEMRRR